MKKVIATFYDSFKKLDAEAMIECYSENIVFEDPAFGILNGEKANNMWRMLCQNSKDLKIDYRGVSISGNQGRAIWEAHYTFSQSGRKVHNIIHSKFEFENGKISKHTDTFDLRIWAKQALGFKGFLLGGTSFFKKKLNAQTNKLLIKFESK